MTFDTLPRCIRCSALHDPAAVVEVASWKLHAKKVPFSRWHVEQEADDPEGPVCASCVAKAVDEYDGPGDSHYQESGGGPLTDPATRRAMVDADRSHLLP